MRIDLKAVVLAAFGFVALAAADGSRADPVSGGCRPGKLKYLASDPLPFRNELDGVYLDLDQAALTFRQGGSGPSCVLVRFSAVPDASRNVLVQALMDGITSGLPLEVQLVGGDDVGANARNLTFVFPRVEPGTHTVRIQYNKLSSGGFADMNAHNLIVWYAR